MRHRAPWCKIDEVEIATQEWLTGLTIAGYLNRLEVFHRQNLEWHISAN